MSGIRVLHLGTEKPWRGGENQVRQLIEGLAGQVELQVAATPKTSAAYLERRWPCELVALASTSPLDPRNVLQVSRAIRQHKINLIDAHTAGAHSLALYVLRFHPEVRLVVHRRVDNPPKATWSTRRKYFSKRVDRYVAISQFIGEVLKKYGVSADKIRVVRSAVDDQVYSRINRQVCRNQLAQELGLDVNRVWLGMVAPLVEQKGHETLLRALPALKERAAEFHVILAGDGVLAPRLKSLASELGIETQISWLGHRRDVNEILKSLDVLCAPSNWEGLGTVILDGMLAGCAIVASDVGGIPEIVYAGTTGLLHPPKDSQALAAHLKTLIDSPSQRQSLALKAGEFARRECSVRAMIEGNLRVYQEVLSQT